MSRLLIFLHIMLLFLKGNKLCELEFTPFFFIYMIYSPYFGSSYTQYANLRNTSVLLYNGIIKLYRIALCLNYINSCSKSFNRSNL